MRTARLFFVFIVPTILVSNLAFALNTLSDIIDVISMGKGPVASQCKLENVLKTSPTPFKTTCADDRALSLVSFELPRDRQRLQKLRPMISELINTAGQRALSNTLDKSKTIADFVIELDHVDLRIEYDEPGGGLLVFEHSQAETYLTGFLMFNEFATWSNEFKFEVYESVRPLSTGMTLALAGLKQMLIKKDHHTEIPDLCELSFLIGLGNGRDLLKTFLRAQQAEGRYKFVILDSLDTASTFYRKFGFVEVGARARAFFEATQQGRRKKRAREVLEVYCQYYHYTNREEAIAKNRKPSIMMARPVDCDVDSADCSSTG